MAAASPGPPDALQDISVTTEEADEVYERHGSEIVTCWFPLVDVGPDMGALQIHPDLAAGRRQLETNTGGRGGLIVPGALPAAPPLDATGMRAGDLLLISAYTPHHSVRNRSDKVRWTMDIRFQKAGTHSGRARHPAFHVRSAEAGWSRLTHAEWDAAWAATAEYGAP